MNKKFSLANKLKSIKRRIELEIPDLTEEELNQIPHEDDDLQKDYVYDPSAYFRKEVLEKGFVIKKLIAVYYQGWECDEWACICEKSNETYKITTNHGSMNIEKISK